jgi:hypothetical protein
MTAVAEAVENNDIEHESDIAMVTAADNDSNSNSSSGGNDDNGGSGDSKGSKNLTIN